MDPGEQWLSTPIVPISALPNLNSCAPVAQTMQVPGQWCKSPLVFLNKYCHLDHSARTLQHSNADVKTMCCSLYNVMDCKPQPCLEEGQHRTGARRPIRNGKAKKSAGWNAWKKHLLISLTNLQGRADYSVHTPVLITSKAGQNKASRLQLTSLTFCIVSILALLWTHERM